MFLPAASFTSKRKQDRLKCDLLRLKNSIATVVFPTPAEPTIPTIAVCTPCCFCNNTVFSKSCSFSSKPIGYEANNCVSNLFLHQMHYRIHELAFVPAHSNQNKLNMSPEILLMNNIIRTMTVRILTHYTTPAPGHLYLQRAKEPLSKLYKSWTHFSNYLLDREGLDHTLHLPRSPS